MNLIPWRDRGVATSFRDEFDSLMNRFLEQDGFDKLPEAFRGVRYPPVNVSETDKTWTVSVELPGLNEKDIQVEFMGHELVISGERRFEEEKKNKEFRRVESQYGAFQRTISIPENVRVEPDSANATYKRGILEVTLQKVEPTPKAKIPVKSA